MLFSSLLPPGQYANFLFLLGCGQSVTFGAAAAEVSDILAAADRDRFRHLFDEVRAFFVPFTHEALEQSSFLIDRLVERL